MIHNPWGVSDKKVLVGWRFLNRNEVYDIDVDSKSLHEIARWNGSDWSYRWSGNDISSTYITSLSEQELLFARGVNTCSKKIQRAQDLVVNCSFVFKFLKLSVHEDT